MSDIPRFMDMLRSALESCIADEEEETKLGKAFGCVILQTADVKLVS